MEAALRSCLLKLQFLETSLKPLPAGCTFEVLAYASDRAALPIASWVDSDPGRGGVGGGAAWLGAYSDDSVSGGEENSSDGGASPGVSLPDDGAARGVGTNGSPSSHPHHPHHHRHSILPLKSASAGGGALSLQVYVEGGDGNGLSRPGSPTGGEVRR